MCNAVAKRLQAASSGNTGTLITVTPGTRAITGGTEIVTEHIKGAAQVLIGQCQSPRERAEEVQSLVCTPLPHLGTEIPPAMDPGREHGSVGRQASTQSAWQREVAKMVCTDVMLSRQS